MAHPECEAQQIVSLSDDFYKGDRSMRESGYDISFDLALTAPLRTILPMCLNSLSRQKRLGEDGSNAAAPRQSSGRLRPYSVGNWSYVTCGTTRKGMFFDYDFEKKQRSTYVYITTLFLVGRNCNR
jgi:alpha,alpha-trehalase